MTLLGKKDIIFYFEHSSICSEGLDSLFPAEILTPFTWCKAFRDAQPQIRLSPNQAYTLFTRTPCAHAPGALLRALTPFLSTEFCLSHIWSSYLALFLSCQPFLSTTLFLSSRWHLRCCVLIVWERKLASVWAVTFQAAWESPLARCECWWTPPSQLCSLQGPLLSCGLCFLRDAGPSAFPVMGACPMVLGYLEKGLMKYLNKKKPRF